MRKGQKKTMSLKQLQANRNNGRKSKGPKTPKGKARSSLNALKFGILSKQVVVQGTFACENVTEFEVFARQFWQTLAPVGSAEEMLVKDVITTCWRLQRVLVAETGEIAFSADHCQWSLLTEQRMKRVKFETTFSRPGESKLKQSVAGVDYLMEVLQTTRSIVQEKGELTEDAGSEVLRAFGSDEPYGVTFMLSYISEGIKSQIPEDRRDGVDSETFKTRIRDILLAYVDKQLVELRQLRPVLVAREQTESDHLQAAAMLPAPETLDKLLRYETALKRHLYRAMHQLERLQRMRKGEEIPPPMAMTV